MNCRIARLLALLLVVAAAAWAQPAAPDPAASPASLAPIQPPQNLRPTASIDFFRHLLALAPDQREAALAKHNPEQRPVLLAKVREYEAMSLAERELKLRLLQLRLFLVPLLKLPPAQRPASLDYIPDDYDRAYVGFRLRIWDQLSADHQQRILQNPTRLHYFLYIPGLFSNWEKVHLPLITPPPDTVVLENAVARWRSLPEASRQEVIRRVDNFFELSSQQRQAILKTLPESEQPRAWQVVQRLAGWSPEDRSRSLQGLNQLAQMNDSDRQRFILQSVRWEAMTAQEKALWRRLMAVASRPPLPPPPPPPRSPR